MTEGGVAANPSRLDVAEPRPWGWLAWFLVLSVLLIGGMLAWWAVFGFWDTLFAPAAIFGLSFDGRNHLTLAVLLAFVASGSLWVRQGVLHEIQRLGELSGVAPAEVAETLRRNAQSPRAVRATALGLALLVGVAIIPLSQGAALDSVKAWDMHHVWAVASNVALFFLVLDGTWLAIQGWRAIDLYTRAHLSIDLLDRQAISSLGRIGLRGAVLWLGGVTIASTITWGMKEIAPMLVLLSGAFGLATLSLLVPAQIARGRLKEVKRAELERVRAKIAAVREPLLAGDTSGAPERAALLSGLLAYEARIESVQEWPYDTPTLVRFALLSAIAVGSWLGGALVERAVAAVLD